MQVHYRLGVRCGLYGAGLYGAGLYMVRGYRAGLGRAQLYHGTPAKTFAVRCCRE